MELRIGLLLVAHVGFFISFSAHAVCSIQADETVVAAAQRCAGWLQHPDEEGPKAESRVTFPAIPAVSSRDESMIDAGAIADEFFSLIVEIAVERAKRQGLAVVQQKIEQGVCRFPRPTPLKFSGEVLPETCALIKSTDLLALVGQARALRMAVGDDVSRLAINEFSAHFEKLPVVNDPVVAALTLVRRYAATPDFHPGRNDVRPIVEAVLNAHWAEYDAHGRLQPVLKTTKEAAALAVALSSARVYVAARHLSEPIKAEYDQQVADAQAAHGSLPPKPKALTAEVELSNIIVRQIASCRRLLGAEYCPGALGILDWTNLALRAADALDRVESQNYVDALRATLTLLLDSLEKIQQAAVVQETWATLAEKQANLVTIAWTRTVALAVLDSDTPRVVSALATLARDSLNGPCDTDCSKRAKTAALLSGIVAYSTTYIAVPAEVTETERLQLMQAQRAARKEALESVIDVATDRRTRAGDRVLSLGLGVGALVGSSQRVQDASGTFSESLQLSAPLGIALQRLPQDGWIKHLPLHFMVTFLDLGNYLAKDREKNQRADWQAIFAPGLQFGVPIGTSPSNFFVMGGSVSYSPRFSSTSDSSVRGALRYGLFIQFYLPLWDFN